MKTLLSGGMPCGCSQASSHDRLLIKRTPPPSVGFNQTGGEPFGEFGSEGGAIGSGERGGLAVGQGFAGFEQGGELTGEGGERGPEGVEALLETGDLLTDATEEKDEPGGPVRRGGSPGGLGAAQGEVVGFCGSLQLTSIFNLASSTDWPLKNRRRTHFLRLR